MLIAFLIFLTLSTSAFAGEYGKEVRVVHEGVREPARSYLSGESALKFFKKLLQTPGPIKAHIDGFKECDLLCGKINFPSEINAVIKSGKVHWGYYTITYRIILTFTSGGSGHWTYPIMELDIQQMEVTELDEKTYKTTLTMEVTGFKKYNSPDDARLPEPPWIKLSTEQGPKKATAGLDLIEGNDTIAKDGNGKSQETGSHFSWIWKILGFLLFLFGVSYLLKHFLYFTGVVFCQFLQQKVTSESYNSGSEMPKSVKRIIWAIQSFNVFQGVFLGCFFGGAAVFLGHFLSLQPTWLFGVIGFVFTAYSLMNTAHKKQLISIGSYPSMETDVVTQAELQGTFIGMFAGLPAYILIFLLALYKFYP